MSKILNELKTYLELYEIKPNEIHSILERKDIQLYSILKEKLTHVESLELVAILNEILSNPNEIKKIQFKDLESIRNVLGDSNIIQQARGIFEINSINKKNMYLEFASILQLEPIDIAKNYFLEM